MTDKGEAGDEPGASSDLAAGGSARLCPGLAPLPLSVRAARAFVRDVLWDVGRDDLVEAAQVAVSEVVTNAVVHAGTLIDVVVTVSPSVVRVTVVDGNDHLPRPRDYADTAGTGRGLHLVADLTADWGVDVHPGGKAVWFDLPGRPTSHTGPGPGSTNPDPNSRPGSTHTGEPATTPPTGAEDGSTTVWLLNTPVLLYSAWRQHAESLLRELFLITLDHGFDDDAVRVHSQASDALALLDEVIPERHPAATPAAALEAATDPAGSSADVTLQLPAGASTHFATLNTALTEAVALADVRELLTPPVQTELRLLREWLCGQVRSQTTEQPPQPWATDDTTLEPTVPGPPPVWDTAPVERSDRTVLAADDTGYIIAASAAVAWVLGYSDPRQLVGQRLIALIPERFRQAHLAGFTLHLLTDDGAMLSAPVTVPLRRRDGTETALQLTLAKERCPGGRCVFIADLRTALAASTPVT